MLYRFITNMKSKKNILGFTLIEILVGISIIITASTIVIAILVSSFRTSSKTTASDIVRQNGNNAITQLSKMIQFSDGFRGVSVDSTEYIESCVASGSQPYYYLKILIGNEEKIISCNNSKGILINGEYLFDQKRVSLVSGSCKFSCSQKNLKETPVIGIDFSLMSSLSDSSSTLPEKNTVINFKTSVKMRNQ